MPDFKIHLSQAKHNEEAAKKLVNEPPYHDWGITAAFYSAIHYFEFWLFNQPEKHTETSIPLDQNGKPKCSLHSWREHLIQVKLNKKAFLSYRKLRNESNISRYLSSKNSMINKTAFDYHTPDDAKNLLNNELITFKKSIGI